MNKKYLSFLFKERKVPILFFFAIYLGIACIPFVNGITKDAGLFSIQVTALVSVLLTFGLPIILLAFVHRKRSVDVHFALPLSRRQQIITILFFCFMVSFGYFALTNFFTFVLFPHFLIRFYQLVIIIAIVAFMLACLCVIHSFLFLIANNLFDGFVIFAAYSFLPYFLYLLWYSFASNLIAGGYYVSFGFSFTRFLSPMYMLYELLSHYVYYLFTDIPHRINLVAYIVIPLVFAIVSWFGIQKNFIERKAERAEQLSDGFFAYPFIIHVYLFLCLLSFACEAVAGRSYEIIFLFLLLFAVYIVSTFIYRRKIELNWKYILIYLVSMAVSFGIAMLGWNTHDFGLGDRLELSQGEKVRFHYSYHTDKDSYLGKWEFGENEFVSINYDIEIPTKQMEQFKEVIDLFEEKRKKSVEYFYAREYPYDVAYMNVHFEDKITTTYYGNRSYTTNPFTKEEYQILDKYGDFVIYDMNGNEITLKELYGE